MGQGKRHSFLYEFGLLIVWLGAQVFYRRFNIVGIDKMPEDSEPTILVSNHQNGMMDPIMLCISNPRQLHFLTRADIFKNKWNNKILRSLNMLPVYRPHDRQANMKEMNAETFNECTRRILAGDVISLFPEGNHNNKKSLRPLKTGVLKVAINAYSKKSSGQKVKIVPVGLEYSHYERFREDLLIIYGDEIIVDEFMDGESELQSSNNLREKINEELDKVMTNIQNKEYYKSILDSKNLSEDIVLKKEKLERTPVNIFRSFQIAVKRIQNSIKENPVLGEDFAKEVKNYKDLKQKHGIWERDILDSLDGRYSKLKNSIFMILGLVPFLLGFLTNILPLKFTENFVKKNVKDPHFTSSIRIAIGSFSYLIYYIIIFLLIWIVWGFIYSLISTLALVLFGLIALWYAEAYERRKNHSKIEGLSEAENEELFAQRDKLISLIQQLTLKE